MERGREGFGSVRGILATTVAEGMMEVEVNVVAAAVAVVVVGVLVAVTGGRG